MPELIPGAEPFSADGGPHGALVLHGFTGNPGSIRGIAEALASAGFNVKLPRLPGHGTTVEDMLTTTWDDWSAAAEAAFETVAERSERVIVVGLSMGGTLTAWLGTRHPEIAGLAFVNAAIEPADAMLELVDPMIEAGETVMDGIGSDIADPDSFESAYEKTPLLPLRSLVGATVALQPGLADIRCPVLIMTAPQDHVVPPSNSDHLAASVSGPVERITLERSYHVATLDYDRDLIETSVVEFAPPRHFGTMSLTIVGGCGRVGLPLGVVLADAGCAVTLFDINAAVVEQVSSGTMPFHEDGAAELLTRTLAAGTLRVTTDPASVSEVEHVVVVVGTPVDRYHNPVPRFVLDAVEGLVPYLRDGQHLVLRSTVYPGVTAMVEKLLASHRLDIDVSFCPERIAEGRAVEELCSLPQIVSGRTPSAVARASALFSTIAPSIVELGVEEAELAKLFTNTWRYIKFAAANQLYMIANDFGLDFERIRSALTEDYPRAQDMPGPGFAAGPCLFKDTMQIVAAHGNNFTLGHASVMVNEGMPLYLLDRIQQRYDLAPMTVGILGMAFKAESDDPRASLSYKLRRLLELRAARVLCTDPYVVDPTLLPLDDVVAQSDLLVVGTPHDAYRTLEVPCHVPVVDLWNVRGQGVLT